MVRETTCLRDQDKVLHNTTQKWAAAAAAGSGGGIYCNLIFLFDNN